MDWYLIYKAKAFKLKNTLKMGQRIFTEKKNANTCIKVISNLLVASEV